MPRFSRQTTAATSRFRRGWRFRVAGVPAKIFEKKTIRTRVPVENLSRERVFFVWKMTVARFFKKSLRVAEESAENYHRRRFF